MEEGGNWEEREGGEASGAPNAVSGGAGALEAAGEPVVKELVLWKDNGLQIPENQKSSFKPRIYSYLH